MSNPRFYDEWDVIGEEWLHAAYLFQRTLLVMDNSEAIQEVAKQLNLTVIPTVYEAARDALAAHVNQLLLTRFDQLISILYRVDVSEAKLKTLLQENPNQDAGLLIADLLIERQAQKIKSRRDYSQRDNDMDDSEKW